MHYNDGTPAQLGDIVRGRGYNLPHEIIGTVVGGTVGCDSCNIQVVTARTRKIDSVEHLYGSGLFHNATIYDRETSAYSKAQLFCTEPYLEYGPAKDFQLVHRPEKKD